MSPLGIPQEKDISLRMMFVGLIYETRTVLYEQTVIALEASSFFFLSYVSCMSLSGYYFCFLPCRELSEVLSTVLRQDC